MLTYVLFIIGFAFLIKGANLLVDGASSLAKKLKISDLTIGLTVVAFGTSLPELFVNIVASFKGTTDIAIGNILGSNIANVFLILGISAIIFPLVVSKGTAWKEIPLSLLAALLVAILANDYFIDRNVYSGLTRIDGLVFISFFIIFLYYAASIAQDVQDLPNYTSSKQYNLIKSLSLVIGGLTALIIGGKWIVDGAVYITLGLGISQSLIGSTIVAVGTSLPELATSAVAAYKKNADIAVGNVVGSNIFNIFFILGISSVIRPLPFSKELNIDIGIMILASLFLFVCMFTGKKHKLDRWEGMVFIFFYVCYISFLVIRG